MVVPSTMKVPELRAELKKLGQDHRGLKKDLVARLQRVLAADSNEENENSNRRGRVKYLQDEVCKVTPRSPARMKAMGSRGRGYTSPKRTARSRILQESQSPPKKQKLVAPKVRKTSRFSQVTTLYIIFIYATTDQRT
jgi:hypothetical protein